MKNILATVALIGSMGLAHAQNLVVDGSFESVKQAPGTWNVYTALPGWTTTSGPGIEVRDQLAGKAFDGNNFVELDSTSNSAMAQTLSTVAGQSYVLSFAYSARGGVPASSTPISVSWDGTLVGTADLDGTHQSGNVWNIYSYTVTARGNDVLSFAAGGASDGYGGSLDAVSVVAAVPEPSTVLLMLGGMVVIGLSLRGRRGGR